ncbi:MAG: DUF4404 family protein [Candidatus Caenarcaniphilales bacterium]|nr:DUF4404 family protein [Candidatus Caenarcaniphilales bacterium]
MIEETIKKIEQSLRESESFTPEKRKELLGLLEALKKEVAELPVSHQDQAQRIMRFTELSAYEITHKNQNSKLQKLSLEGLNESVKEFEASHPQLVASVNAFCQALSGMGI